MRTILTILLFLPFAINAQPVANAGADQTIYLTTTNSVTWQFEKFKKDTVFIHDTIYLK
jgi:hypothetical protein